MKPLLSQLVHLIAVLFVSVQSTYQFSLRDAHLPSHMDSTTGRNGRANGKVLIGQVQRDEAQRPCEGRLGPERPCMKSGDTCYCFIPFQRSWREAYEFCNLHDMFLLSIQNMQKQLDVQGVVPQLAAGNELVTEIGVWTSGTFISAMKTFTWTSPLKLFSFVNWMYGSPLLSFLDCVRIIPSRGSIWSDVECDEWLPFICESHDKQVAIEPVVEVQEATEPTSKPTSIPDETETSKPSTSKPANSTTSEKPATSSPKPPSTTQSATATAGSNSKPEDVHIHVSVSVAEIQ